MKNKILAGAGLLACGVMAFAAKDPIIMTVNGVDVPLSEFEYLYHKNAEQQLASQPLDEYVEMFKLYKLKVADARAEGIDTTAAFRRDVEQYRHDLALPYLTDSVYLNKLIDETFARSREEAEFKHVMIRKAQDMKENKAKRQLADSLLHELRNGADFDALARTYSEDARAAQDGGNLGFLTVMHLPYELESASYSLAPGQYSEVLESPVGYHIVAGGRRRPARGQVLASHIMKMVPETASDKEKADAKIKIDSIYTELLKDPAQFERMASQLSDDRGSARQGGMLPKFSAGDMVEEFDSVAFSLDDNEISAPVRSRFGWHIIKKNASFEPATREQLKPALLSRFNNPQDGRYRMIRDHQTDVLSKKHKGSLNKKTLGALYNAVGVAGLDSTFYASQAPMLGLLPVAKIDGGEIPLSAFFGYIHNYRQSNPEMAAMVLDNAIAQFYNTRLVEAEENWLDRTNPEYHNLLNEYTDGSLLFEVSNRKVWDKASKDVDGLKKFFEANRGNYAFKEPRVKGILIQTKSDSISSLVRTRLQTLGGDTIVRTLSKEFPRDLKAEVVLAKKGDNAMVDNLCFKGPEAKPSAPGMKDYFIINERILTEPEDYTDVRGAVTGDYQTWLEDAWVERLRSKYPVTVNRKVLGKVKVK